MKTSIFKTIFFAGSFFALSTVKAQVPTLLRLQVSGNSMQNETVVYFDTAGSPHYDAQYDAPSLGADPGHVNIVSVFDSIDFQVKCLPTLAQDIGIPLKITTGSCATYFMEGVEMQNLPSGACLILHDNFTNTDTDLRAGGYSCFISDTESVARFVLNIRISLLHATAVSVTQPTCTNSANGQMIVCGPGAGPWNYYWKDSLNNILQISLNKMGADTLLNANAGLYKVDINTPGNCDNGSLEFTLKGSAMPVAFFTSDTLAPLYYDVKFINESSGADSFWWDFGDGGGSADTNAVYAYSAAGIYTIILSAYSNTCNETATFTREVTISGSLSIEQPLNTSEKVIIGTDAGGLFVKFNYPYKKTGAHIDLFDISGRSLAEEIKLENAGEQKIYLPVNTSTLQVVRVITDAGDIKSGKFLLSN